MLPWQKPLLTIGGLQWRTNYDDARDYARRVGKPLWLHFGEYPGCGGCQDFAAGPLSHPLVIDAAQREYVLVFFNTQDDERNTQRFQESYGSYPVMRIQDHLGHELAERLDTNPSHGQASPERVLTQLNDGLQRYRQLRNAASKS